jgi:hypothetical protein
MSRYVSRLSESLILAMRHNGVSNGQFAPKYMHAHRKGEGKLELLS